MNKADAEFAVCCAVPIDAKGLTIISRPAGRFDDASAKFSAKYGQSTGVAIFDDVLIPWDNVFLSGEWDATSTLLANINYIEKKFDELPYTKFNKSLN